MYAHLLDAVYVGALCDSILVRRVYFEESHLCVRHSLCNCKSYSATAGSEVEHLHAHMRNAR